MSWEPFAVVLAGYALGCINFAYYGVRLFTGKDIRSLGSGNPGARNAGRVFGSRAFLLVTIGDMGKGAAAVALALWCDVGELATGTALVASVIGHCWPIQMGFRGGKGVNAMAGSNLVYAPWVLAWYAFACVAGLRLRRGLNFASALGFASAPIAMLIMGYRGEVIPTTVGCAICLWRARKDVRKAFRA